MNAILPAKYRQPETQKPIEELLLEFTDETLITPDIEEVHFPEDVIDTPAVQLQAMIELVQQPTCSEILTESGVSGVINRIVFSAYAPFRKYIVKSVRNDLTIESLMESKRGSSNAEPITYADYLARSHGIEIKNKDAPMLEVSGLSTITTSISFIYLGVPLQL